MLNSWKWFDSGAMFNWFLSMAYRTAFNALADLKFSFQMHIRARSASSIVCLFIEALMEHRMGFNALADLKFSFQTHIKACCAFSTFICLILKTCCSCILGSHRTCMARRNWVRQGRAGEETRRCRSDRDSERGPQCLVAFQGWHFNCYRL